MPLISIRCITVTVVFAGSLLASNASAQTPPIKPGLWEVKGVASSGGQPRPDAAEGLKKLPPEARARIEAMMKEKGVAMGAGGAIRVCLTKEKLNADAWHNEGSCKTDYLQRTSAAWKWHSVCSQPQAESDGEAIFTSSTSYVIKTTSTLNFKGQMRTTQRTINASWVGADCGDLKPLDPKR